MAWPSLAISERSQSIRTSDQHTPASNRWPYSRAYPMPFRGKVILVTGGTSEIGQATAELLAGRGARVVLSGCQATDGNLVSCTQAGERGWFVLRTSTDTEVLIAE